VAGINADPCSEATSRCGWAKLSLVQLFGAGGDATGEWRRRSGEAVAPRGQGLDPVRRMKKRTPPDEIFVWGRGWAEFFTPTSPNDVWGF
jgi:hypothetical protein